jgi:hypothetical protein
MVLGPGLTVTATGAEPRALLQYTVPALDRDLRIRVVDADNATHAMLADLRYHVHCAPCTYRLTSAAFENLPANNPKMVEMAKQLHGTIELPSDGKVVLHPDTAMDTTPSTTELFKMLAIRLPTEPVGAGARWTFIDGPATTTYELIDRSDSGARLEVRSYASDATQTVEVRGVLAVKLADPFATGTLTEMQTIAAPKDSKMPPFKVRSTLTIE